VTPTGSCLSPDRPAATGLIKDMQLVVIDGGAHAIAWTHSEQVDQALLTFLK